MYSDVSRGRFCLPAALLGIHKFQNSDNVASDDIDAVLSEADILYQEVIKIQNMQRGSFPYAFLAFSDLHKQIQTSNEKFMIEFKDSEVLLGECISKDAANLSLSEAVEESFKTCNASLIIVGDLAFSVFLNILGEFCYFDSHSRNNQGDQCDDGAAILMRFPTLHHLQLQLFRLIRSLGFTRYELQPIQVHRDNNTAPPTQLPIPTAPVLNDGPDAHNTVSQNWGTVSPRTIEVMSRQSLEGLSSNTSANLHESQCTSEMKECVPADVIQGSMSQADSCFAQYKNKQLSLSNVLTSLTCLQKVHEIERSDVNNILLEGARLHDNPQSKAFPRDIEKAIPQVLSGTNGKYSVHEIETFEGVLKNARSSRTRKSTRVVEGLHKAFTRSEMLIISLGNYMLSSFKSSDGPLYCR